MSDKQELKKTCYLADCGKLVKKKDKYCSMHRARFNRTGRFDLKSDIDKFLEKTKLKVKHHLHGCWDFQGYINEFGYGRLRHTGRKILAHRLSWILFNGDIPEDTLVLHKCDNPKCVNPQHLFLGTHKDNHKDAVDKGRIDTVKRAKERWIKCPTWKKKK